MVTASVGERASWRAGRKGFRMETSSAALRLADTDPIVSTDGDLEVTGWTDLRAAILELEEAAAVPARGRGWVGRMGSALQRLADDLTAHAVAEDGPGGLYRRVTGDAPRLAG